MVARITTNVKRAAKLLRHGAVGVFPTDTVYACGADALSATALAKLSRLRGREAHKPFLTHISDLAMLDLLVAEISPIARELMERYWPGPLTIIFDRPQPDLPVAIAPPGGGVAVRLPDNSLERELIRLCGRPLAAPSANPPGQAVAVTARDAHAYFGRDCAFYLDGGPSRDQQVSTIVAVTATAWRIIRPGVISLS